MKIALAIALTTLAWTCVEGLYCWTCINSPNNDHCQKNGKYVECLQNENTCHNSFRRTDKGALITKRCKQDLACDNNWLQNDRDAWMPTQCNGRVPSSVCRCCCVTDGCNAPQLPCRKDPVVIPQEDALCDPLPTPRFAIQECTEDGMKVGTVCNFECDDGRYLSGIKSSECVRGLGTPIFTNPPPRCLPMECPLLRAPRHGAMSCSRGSRVGSRCTFSCTGIHERFGPRVIVCRRNAKWSSEPPTCVNVFCPRRNPPVNGRVSCSLDNLENTICDFECVNNNFRLVGSPSATCLDVDDDDLGGRWSHEVPDCELKVCPAILSPINGYVSCSDESNINSQCDFLCNDNYRRVGNSDATCVEQDGGMQWDKETPTCELITCPDLQSTPQHGQTNCSNGALLLSVCTFECAARHELLGDESITCQLDGSWTNVPPACVLVTCPDRDPPANGEVSCTYANDEDSLCSYNCEANYDLIGSPTAVCEDLESPSGVWSSPVPVCEPKRCSDITNPENGYSVCSNGNVLSSQCEFACDDNHQRVGSLYATCVDQDGVRQWDNETPVCEPITCPDEGTFYNGIANCTNGNFAGSVCVYTCNEEKDFVLEPPEVTTNQCLNDSTWSLPRPCCSETCPPQINFDGVIILDSSSSTGADNFRTMKEFVKLFLDLFDLSANASRVGVFRYNREVDTRTQIHLRDYAGNVRALKRAIDRIPYDGSGTFTGQALRHARNDLQEEDLGSRPGVHDIILVITDGRSQDDVSEISQQLREDGTAVIVIGVVPPRGRLSLPQLRQIATRPEDVLVAEGGFESLNLNLFEGIADRFCVEGCLEG
ncbi:unnamed protein product [Clavelina lepadiformis]|uniref:Uncharacterized protein n=2 Tax=Clavelina lepadiformis TaxID=159417 RepID=A0ABP0FTN8_CLALP